MTVSDETDTTTEHQDAETAIDDGQEPGGAAGLVAVAAPAEHRSDDGDTKTPVIPDRLPVLPLREHVAFPGTVMPLSIGREKSKRVLNLALASDKLIAVVAQRNKDVEDPTLDDLHRVGTACHILKMLKLPDGTETIIVHGITRIGLEDLVQQTPYLAARVQTRNDTFETDTEVEALVHNTRHTAERIMQLSPNVPDEARIVLDNIEGPGNLADFLAANLSLSLVHKQELLETFDVKLRLRKVYAALSSQLEVLELSSKLHEEVRGRMNKAQRDYYLREQLKAIQSELGQSDAAAGDVERLTQRVEEAKLPEAAAEAAHKELERLQAIPQASPEYGLVIDYVDWLVSLPWSTATEDQLDLNNAARILDEDHYDLEKVKRRILEFLAVRRLKPDGKGSILCFAGPPGVGKTSLGRSIARAMGRNFTRMSLGGVHDESTIRGHRRTYVASMPGRILQNIRKCGSNNPVFMLDEVDKIGQDFRGDPSSALLEVLDPAQNDTFTDHYLDVPFDLSDVLFISTCNYLETVPPPLRDRMEIITLSSYTQREKLHIAVNYLVPRQIEENGLTADRINFTDDAVRLIISGYTREAGVRELERQIGAVCRAQAARVVRENADSLTVTERTVHDDLGAIKYVSEFASRASTPGVVTGLAFTPVGGDILFIETSRMPGKGALSMTGQLGDVMRESAQAAFTQVRANARRWKIKTADLPKTDLHIHVPAGATPKDGPSAGVAMFMSLVSALTEKKVDPRTAMTGEITLRGAVLPVGGIKEKLLAAHRAGITRVLLPEQNLKDLDEIPEDVRRDLRIVPVTTIDDVVKTAFKPNRKRAASKSNRKRTPTKSRPSPKRKPRAKRTRSPQSKSKKKRAPAVKKKKPKRRPASKKTKKRAKR